MGLFFAAALESFHFALWDNHRRRRSGEKDMLRNELGSGVGSGVESGKGSVNNDDASHSSASSSSRSTPLDAPLLGGERGGALTVTSGRHHPLTHTTGGAHNNNHNNHSSNNNNHNHNNNASLNIQSTHTTTTTATATTTTATATTTTYYASMVEGGWEFVYRAFNVSDDRATQVHPHLVHIHIPLTPPTQVDNS